MVPGYERDGEICLALSGAGTYRPIGTEATEKSAAVTLLSEFEDRTVLKHTYTLSESGVDIALTGAKKLAFSFLAFDFDGETKTDIAASEKSVRVTYEGYTCTYETNGKILFKDEYADNRNGRYRVYYATAEDVLSLHISIEEAK